MTLSVPKGTLLILRDLVHERTGVFFDDARLDALVDKLEPRVLDLGHTSLLDYYYRLKYDADAAREWPRVLDALAVPETYFWREVDQLKAIVAHLVPECMRTGGRSPVRIWCAAAATGEEPLTLAMLLEEAGALDPGRVQILASDGSGQLVARARLGVFRERAVRLLPPELLLRHFTTHPGGYHIAQRLLSSIAWGTANLRDADQVAAFADVSIILSRNVFIYFSDRAIADTAGRFAALMREPGYLCLGAAESLLRLRMPFEMREVGGAFVYRRTRRVEAAASAEAQTWTACFAF